MPSILMNWQPIFSMRIENELKRSGSTKIVIRKKKACCPKRKAFLLLRHWLKKLKKASAKLFSSTVLSKLKSTVQQFMKTELSNVVRMPKKACITTKSISTTSASAKKYKQKSCNQLNCSFLIYICFRIFILTDYFFENTQKNRGTL